MWLSMMRRTELAVEFHHNICLVCTRKINRPGSDTTGFYCSLHKFASQNVGSTCLEGSFRRLGSQVAESYSVHVYDAIGD